MKLFDFKKSLTFLLALLFTILFYKNLIGINLLIFELISISLGLFLFKPKFKTVLSKIILFGTLVTCVMVIIHNSSIAKTVNLISYLLLISSISNPNFILIKNYIFQIFENFLQGIGEFFDALFSKKGNKINLFYSFKIIGAIYFVVMRNNFFSNRD